MIVKAWTNSRAPGPGEKPAPGSGYGFSVREDDRDEHFSKEWASAFIDLPNGKVAKVNVAKKSFWKSCRELISSTIKEWLEETGNAGWEKGKRPEFVLSQIEGNRFRIDGSA